MGFGHSKDSEFFLGGTDLSGYVNTVTLDEDHGVADTTVLNDSAKTYVRGQTDGTLSFGGPHDPLIGTLIESPGTALQSFAYFPQGSVSGKTYAQGSCFITSKSGTSPLDSAAEWSADAQISGPVTWGTVA